MNVIGAVFLFLCSIALFKMGIGALKESGSHAEYGVESESLHKKFSWVFIGLGAVLACAAGLLLAG